MFVDYCFKIPKKMVKQKKKTVWKQVSKAFVVLLLLFNMKNSVLCKQTIVPVVEQELFYFLVMV